MPEEIEVKVRVPGAPGPEAFRRRMAGRAGPCEGPVLEVNRLFDDAAGRLRGRGAALRIREERDLDEGKVLRTTLTYKGPRRRSGPKRRQEIELKVEAAEPLVAILEAVGLRQTFRYDKRRTRWHVGACEVALDELPHLGWFVEVEGPDERTIRRQMADLGLADAPTIDTDYVHLLADHLASVGDDAARAVFDG